MNHFDPQRAFAELQDRYNLHFVDVLIKNGYKVYLFGGSIRDMVMNKEWKDADIRAWVNLPPEDRDKETERLLKEAGIDIKSVSKFNDSFTVFRFLPKGSKSSMGLDLSVVSDQWLVGPDFTINGLYFDLETKELIDNYNAVADINTKIIRTAKEPLKQFAEEPYMIFRAVKAACQFNFEIEEKTFQAMKDLSGLTAGVLKIVADNVVPGLTEWFLGNIFTPLKYNPSLFEKLWNETETMDVFLNFTKERLGYKSENKLEKIFDQDQEYTWEEAISIFLSAVAYNLNPSKPAEAFEKITALFKIKEEKQYQDFLINTSKITLKI